MRIDKWLFVIRVSKSRSIAANLCDQNKILVNSVLVKSAKEIKPGDIVVIKLKEQTKIVEVLLLPASRLGFPEAIKCYIDKSEDIPVVSTKNTGVSRDRGLGRPSKKDRRDIEKLKSEE